MSAATQRLTRRPILPGGFALMEVLVALTLLAVGIVGVLTAVLAALDLQKDSAMRYRAGLILQDKLAEIQFVPYDGETARGVSADGLFDWTVVGAPWQGQPPTGDQLRDADSSAAIVACLHEVRIEVSWRADRGIRRLAATQLVRLQPSEEAVP